MLCEVVGPRNLSVPLDLAQYEALFNLGWPHAIDDVSGNHRRLWWPWSIGAAASTLTDTLALVFGATSPAALVIERADNDRGGGPPGLWSAP